MWAAMKVILFHNAEAERDIPPNPANAEVKVGCPIDSAQIRWSPKHSEHLKGSLNTWKAVTRTFKPIHTIRSL